MVKIVFFGSSDFSVYCLDDLKTRGFLPSLIITTPDQPAGRKLIMTPTPVKAWAMDNKVQCLAPEKLNTEFIEQIKNEYSLNTVFLVASYGKIIPKSVIDLPEFKTLNIHPSLLPKYRGPSPLQTQILNNEKEVGVSIMLIDEKVDHGPILVQKKVSIPDWPVKFIELEKITAEVGAKLFIDNLPAWTSGQIEPREQDHKLATFTQKIEKTDGLLDLELGDPLQNFLKIQAFSTWPQAHFFIVKNDKKVRVIIKGAEFSGDKLFITKVLPEGKKEMTYADFLRGLK